MGQRTNLYKYWIVKRVPVKDQLKFKDVPVRKFVSALNRKDAIRKVGKRKIVFIQHNGY